MATLNAKAEQQLNSLGFNMQRIKSNDYMVNQINKFIDIGGELLPVNPGEQGAYYNPGTKKIHFEANSPYVAYNVLAHELGHALGEKQSEAYTAYDTAKKYAAARGTGEADAIYNEFTTIEQEIKQNGKAVDTHISQDLYSKVKGMSVDQAYDFLAKQNMYGMTPSGGGGGTYYEQDMTYYLFNGTNFQKDYQDAGLSQSQLSQFTKKMIDFDTLGDRYDNGNIDAQTAFDRKSLLDGQQKTMLTGEAYMYGDAGNDVLKGTKHNDIVLGGEGNDKLYGNEGNDTLAGNAGDDIFYSGLGADTIIGGAGNDQVNFTEALNNNSADTIKDFTAGSDKIGLGKDIFAALEGGIEAAEFGLGTTASGEQHILFDKASGNLYYDADSAGGGAAVHFATVSGSNLDQLNQSSFAIV